jgi:phytoene dehydrogenase-like protein
MIPPPDVDAMTVTKGHPPVASFDTVVVGAGLAGMTAALRLRMAGLSVSLFDRSHVAGGLCGSFEHEGYHFTRGCNDFAGRFARELAAVGVEVPFRPSTHLIYLGEHRFTQPPDLKTTYFALRHAPDLVRLVRSIHDERHATMDDVLTHVVRSETASSLVATLAYPMGTAFYRLSREAVRRALSPRWRYGYGRSVVPANGAQSITDAMLTRLMELDVTPRLGVTVGEVTRDAEGFLVRTSEGVVRARAVLRGGDRARPANEREGLSVVQFLFVLPRSLPWLPGARALIVLPEKPEEWLSTLDQGRFPTTFAFHVFRDLDQGDEYTVTGYCLAPRGVDALDPQTADGLRATIVRRIDQEVPGFAAALRHAWVIDAATYFATHGLRPVLALGAEDRAVARDEATGQYLIGNVGVAPGEHATGAVVSAAIGAQEVIATLSPA